MRHKIWRNPYGDERFFYQINNTRDLFDKKRFIPKSFKEFREITGHKHERDAKLLCIKMFKYMVRLMADDMIYNRDMFVLPRHKMGYMRVADTTDVDSPGYKYYFDTEGKRYSGRIYINGDISKQNKKHYCLKLNRTHFKKILSLVKEGMKY